MIDRRFGIGGDGGMRIEGRMSLWLGMKKCFEHEGRGGVGEGR